VEGFRTVLRGIINEEDRKRVSALRPAAGRLTAENRERAGKQQ